MKTGKRILLGVAVLLAALIVTVIFGGGHVVKTGVNTIGPQVMGVPVRLDKARFHPLRGHLYLSGLVVGNPDGFRTDSLFDIRNLEVDFSIRSLFTDTIVIRRIVIDAPQITYEVGAMKTNLGALLEQLEARQQSGEIHEADAGKAPGVKTIVIEELILADARAQVTVTALRGRTAAIQLGTVTLHDFGGDGQRVTQITTQVVRALFSVVVNAVTGAGGLIGDGMKAALEGAGGMGGLAVDGVGAAADAAGEGARALTDAAGSGVRAVTGLLGRGDDTEDIEPEAGGDDE